MIRTVVGLSLVVIPCLLSRADDAIEIGSRRELLVDDYLIESREGVELVMQRPQPREVALTTDAPWEGNTCAYYTVFSDGERFRMYYRGAHWDTQTKKATHREVVCYAESTDGINWVKPNLGIVEFQGSKNNNIIWDGVGSHNFTPFQDTNPNCSPAAQYKALGRGRSLRKGDQSSKHGLFAFQSSDGVHWKLMSDQPVITEGAFDSQNLAFFDNRAKVYRDYHRWFNQGVRDIMHCTSKDFLNWTKPKGLTYTQQKREHLYTNAIRPYSRAPHLYLGFPTRYLPNEGQRVEPVLMTSRDGQHFHRWPSAVIPESAPKDRRGNRSNYMANGLVELPNEPSQLSVYATEAYYTGPDSRIRRFVYRTDGFVAARATVKGEITSRPIVFSGEQLTINAKTFENGSLRVELQTVDGKPIKGFSREDCQSIRGDSTNHHVSWRGNDLAHIAGQPVRVVFELENSELFAFQFVSR